MIKNVIFDVDGVLRTLIDKPILEVLDEPLKQKYKARYQGMTVKDLYKKYLTHDYKIYTDFDKGLVGDEELIEALCADYNEPIEAINVLFGYYNIPRNQKYFEPTLKFARELKNKGYKLYILSNMNTAVANLLKEYFEPNLFDDILFSCDVHMMKPDLEYYEYAISKWNIDPKESIFIDDREENLEPFSHLGGHTFLFDKNNVKTSVKNLEKYILNN